jgi:hypothetical protein
MESLGTFVEEMNNGVTNPTQSRALPVYEVEEFLVERRLRAGAYLIERNGVQVAMERRRAA